MRRLLPALGLLLLAGCASARPPREARPPVLLPDRFTGGETAEGAVSPRFWEDLGDPRLAAAVEEALARNPALPGAEARVRQAAALARIAGSVRQPDLSAGGTGGRAKRYVGESDFLPPTATTGSYGVSLSVSWEADLWGRIGAGVAAAESDVTASRAALAGARLSIAAQTSKAYLAAVEAEGQLDIARRSARSVADQEARMRERYESGLRSALEWKLLASEVEGARAAVAARERAFDLARRQVEVLAGRYPAAEIGLSRALPPVPGPVPAGLPSDLLRRRPDLAAAEAALRASSARVAEAEAGLYPRLTLTGSGGLANDGLGDLLAGDFSVWSLAAGLVAPIWQGGRLRANVELAAAREDEAAAAFAGTVLTALGEVEGALASEATLRRREQSAHAAAAAARDGLALAEERFLSGLADVLAVLEARRGAFAAESLALAVRRDRLANRIDLYVALGGGFDAARENR